ncbi:MAG TPA: fibrobacter succinogenes major paralogous domain-containing protein [Bacteroidales bacterium]|nr:fibrobacter succinogenes major paralogous domain-containing protein [Bacteroidales bacterium]HOR59740.1 fibrobacter succinogenes major paralogous domain-containing protein [Bacteroidales bacterium]HPL04703.1 fibrobacter succinogenes major paralogous domain-containing protein [Bacteroidales bacterium]
MKKFILLSLLAFFALSLNTAFAQNDSIYVMKNGSIIWEYKIADIDSIIFYKPVIEEEELITGTFIDLRDNTEYSWVQIGEQVWMAENLKYLPSVVGPGTGSNSEVYYYVYDYDGTDVDEAKATENYATYGVLYNWPAAMAGAGSSNSIPSGVQGICPEGWHLPSDAEWQQLEMYLGMSETDANSTGLRGTVEGGKLKEAGYDHWQSPNEGANNESGFTALPGGGRGYYGNFHHIGQIGYWWSSTEKGTNDAWYRYLYFNNSNVTRNYYYSESGFSVRCVRD